MTGLDQKPTPTVRFIVAAVFHFHDGLAQTAMYLDTRGDELPPRINAYSWLVNWEPTQDQATRLESWEAAALWARFVYLRTECIGIHILEAE